MKVIQFTSIAVLILGSYSQKCPAPAGSGCTCHDGSPDTKLRVINCMDVSLTNIPKFEPSSEVFQELTFSNAQTPTASCHKCNRITVIPDNAFQGLKIKVLDLSKNSLTTVWTQAFAGLENVLEELTLKGSDTPVPYTAISRLKKLKKLSLTGFSQSGISRQNTNIQSLVNLQILEFREMDIKFIQSDAFRDRVPMLKQLVLEKLQMKTFPVAGLSELKSITHLSVINMHIEEIPYRAFASLKNLEELVLSHNYLKTLRSGCFDGIADTLKYLGLHINNLDESSVGAIATVRWDKLEQLNLGHNQLTVIPSGLFYNMRKLAYLNIDSNSIKSIQSDDLRGLDSLIFLDASYNSLSKIEKGAFLKTPKLRELDLRGENINYPVDPAARFVLTTDSVLGLEKNLERLILTDTILNEEPTWKAIKSLTELEVLKLGGTQITNIPDFEFENNKRLIYLMVENNNITELTEEKVYGLQESLISLSIGNNPIKVLDECALNKFKKLEMLYINDLPLHCDCDIVWFYNWLQQLKKVNDIKYFLINAVCNSPASIQNRALSNLTKTELNCKSSYQPKKCKDLSSRKLTTSSVVTTTRGVPVTKSVDTENIFSFEKITESSSVVEFKWKVTRPELIKGYRLEYQLLRSFQWKSVDVPRSALSFEMENLQRNSNYLFCLIVIFKESTKESMRPCLVINTLP